MTEELFLSQPTELPIATILLLEALLRWNHW